MSSCKAPVADSVPVPRERGWFRACLILLTTLVLASGSQARSSDQSAFRAHPTSMSRRLNKANNKGRSPAPATIQRGGSSPIPPLKLSPNVFDNGPFWQAQSVFLAANVLGYLVSVVSGGSHLHLDLLGTGAFAAAAAIVPLTATTKLPLRVYMSSAAVFLWGFKLAAFLFYRALITRHDNRLTDVSLAGFWIVSLAWGVLCSLPHTLGTTSSAPGKRITILVGTILYVIGISVETLADYQKWQFKKAHPGQFCNVGLWSISQHPNFAGNLLLWSGIFVMNSSALLGPSGGSFMQRYQRLFLALLSPLFMWALFSGQAKGTITNAVELANAKYGSDPAYQDYVNNVPLIFPHLR